MKTTGLLVVLMMVLASGSAFADLSTTTLSTWGVVTDSSGAPIPGITGKLCMKGTSTGAVPVICDSVTTDAYGQFRAVFTIKMGDYYTSYAPLLGINASFIPENPAGIAGKEISGAVEFWPATVEGSAKEAFEPLRVYYSQKANIIFNIPVRKICRPKDGVETCQLIKSHEYTACADAAPGSVSEKNVTELAWIMKAI